VGETWTDSSFWKIGGFLTDLETGMVHLGKGGRIERTLEIDRSKPGFYLKDFYTDEFVSYFPEEMIHIPMSEMLTSKKLSQEFKVKTNYEDLYRKDFERLQTQWSDSLKKVVLVSRETYSSADPVAAQQQIFERSLNFGTGAPYGLWFDDYGVIGSTPELLFKMKGQSLETIALAGTAKIDQGADLLKSAKDRREHDLVIADIKEKLQDFELSHMVGETRLHPFKSIVHLKTELQFKLKDDVNLTKLVTSLSPTAALGGYKMKSALEFLKSTEYSKAFPQRYFGSTLGLVTRDFTQFIVMIRNVQWHGSEFFIESGGGVLKESQVESELGEIRLKRETVKGHYL
jgi:menaquinone-specific isochorismate synthase